MITEKQLIEFLHEHVGQKPEYQAKELLKLIYGSEHESEESASAEQES